MKFTLRQLEIFVAIARLGSVSRAADVLALSQSATSTALAGLEKQYDTLLFDRMGKRLHLSESGRALLPRAKALIDRASEIELLLKQGSGPATLHFGATLTIGNYLATLLVGEFLRREPASKVTLEVHDTATIIRQVTQFEIDFGLIEGHFLHPDLQTEPWVADELAVFAAPDHSLAGRDEVSLDELVACPWIVRMAGSGTRQTFEYGMREFLPQLQIRLELEHTEAIKRAVESGMGLGCMSRLALKEAFRRGSLVEIPTPALDFRRQFHFVWHRQKFLSPGIERFLALCRTAASSVRRSDEIILRRDDGTPARFI